MRRQLPPKASLVQAQPKFGNSRAICMVNISAFYLRSQVCYENSTSSGGTIEDPLTDTTETGVRGALRAAQAVQTPTALVSTGCGRLSTVLSCSPWMSHSSWKLRSEAGSECHRISCEAQRLSDRHRGVLENNRSSEEARCVDVRLGFDWCKLTEHRSVCLRCNAQVEDTVCGQGFGPEPKQKDADLWVFIWDFFLMDCEEKNRDLDVKHVKAHQTEKEKKAMTLEEQIVMEGNEKAELAKDGAEDDGGAMASPSNS